LTVAERLYLDANVFIYAYETQGHRADAAWQVLEAIERGEFAGVTSELTLAEVLVGALRRKDDELVGRYHEILSTEGDFNIIAVERLMLIEAAFFRSIVKALKLPDAIHVATARAHRCRYIISDDERLPAAGGLRIINLGPQTLDVIRGERS
jgi:predicted nucleic acid-binding protein